MKNVFFYWNYWWLCYHLGLLKKHDARLEAVIPDWKELWGSSEDS